MRRKIENEKWAIREGLDCILCIPKPNEIEETDIKNLGVDVYQECLKVCELNTSFKDIQTVKENATLIASAPELLKEMINMVDLLSPLTKTTIVERFDDVVAQYKICFKVAMKALGQEDE